MTMIFRCVAKMSVGIFIFALFMPLTQLCGANVVWNKFVAEDYQYGLYGEVQRYIHIKDPIGHAGMSCISLEEHFDYYNSTAELAPHVNSGGVWILAALGDVISVDVILNSNCILFEDPMWSSNGQSVLGDPISVDYLTYMDSGSSESIYLAFFDQDYLTPLSGDIEYFDVVGWVELAYEDYQIVVKGSAFDLDGGAMIVGGGAIPEPSGGVMLLIGAALLMLRRRK